MDMIGSLVRRCFGILCVLLVVLCVFPVPGWADPGDDAEDTGDAQLSIPVPEPSLFTGAANYSYPIIVPPGRNGLTPSIAVTYNSQQKSGWLGVGWNLDMGYIQLSTKYGVNYGADDYVASFNGSYAELVRRTQWDYSDSQGSHTCYGAKVEGAFTRYCRASGGGWVATTKDGTKYYFGTTAATQQRPPFDFYNFTFRWCLDKVQDTNGNYMTLNYTQDSYQIYLNEIDYSFNDAGQASNRVIFGLEQVAQSDPDTGWRFAIGMVKTRYRLKTIDVYGNNELARSYTLDYSSGVYYPSYLVRVEQLSSITQMASDGSTLPATTFTYTGEDFQFVTDGGGIPLPNMALYPSSGGWKGWNVTGDFNGDGKTDVLSWADGSNAQYVNMNLSSGDGFAVYQWSANVYLDGHGHPKWWVGDFNGDGKSDLAVADSNNRIWVYLTNSTGDGFMPAIQGPVVHGGGIKYTRTGDFNGDGMTDIITWVSGTQAKVCISTGAGFTLFQNVTVNIYNDSILGPMFWLGDFNGDGKTDIAAWIDGSAGGSLKIHLAQGDGVTSFSFSRSNWSVFPHIVLDNTYGALLYLGDFNGDGKTDIAGYANNDAGQQGQRVNLYWSSGTDFIYVTYKDLAGPPLPRNSKFGPLLGDFNGDGKTDILVWDRLGPPEPPIGTLLYIYLIGSNEVTPVWGIRMAAHFYNDDTNGVKAWTGDFNGDGRTDILAWHHGTNGGDASLHMLSAPVARLLSTVTNGIGGSADITYQPSSAYPNRNMPFVVQTVASKTLHDGNGGTSTTNYNYYGGFYGRVEREFYGFESATQTDPTGVSITTSFLQETTWLGSPGSGVAQYLYKGRISGQTARDSRGGLYKFTNNNYSYTTPFANTAFPYLTQTIESSCDGQCAEHPDGTIIGTRQVGTTFAYDAYGNISQRLLYGDVTPPRGFTATGDERFENTTYNYGECNDLSKWILNRPETTWTTDFTGTVKAQTWFEYDKNNTSICKGNLTGKTDRFDGGTYPNPKTAYDYDSYGNRTSITDPKGNTTSIIYDSATNTYPVTTTVPYLNLSTQRTYDYRFGKPLTDTDMNGNTTQYTYDSFGRISTVTKPLDSPTYPTRAYFYLNFGTVGSQKVSVQLKSSDGNTTWKEAYFDGLGRTILTRRQGPGGNPDPGAINIRSAYDVRGLLYAKSLPYFDQAAQQWTHYYYDPLQRVSNIVHPDGTSETAAYDRLTATFVDANGHMKYKEMDGLGRLAATEEWTGTTPRGLDPYVLYSTTTYEYDPMGHLTKSTDNAGNVTTMTYDTLSRKTNMNDPDMGAWSYTYDPNGNLATQTDAKGHMITFSYLNPQIGRDDPLNRIARKIYRDGTYIAYTYDQGLPSDNPKGRLTSVTDASGSSQFSYDARGRTKATIKTIGGTAYTTQTGYDSRDRITSITYPEPGPSPETISYVYDTAGNLTNVQSNPAPDYAVYSGFNALGQPGTVLYGNSVSTSYTYNPLNSRLTDLTTSGYLQQLHYDYDNVGNISTLTDGLDGTRPQTFYYDALNRLIEADSPAYGTISYHYDTIGNMTLNTQVGPSPYQYTDPLHVHAVKVAGANTYNYDANGNMTGGEGRTFTWDDENRPTNINGVSFVYDYQGQRASKTVGSNTTTYINRLYECTTGPSCTKYIFAAKSMIARKTASGVNYYHPDHLGSSSVVTDGTGNKVEEIYYYPYGQTRTDTGTANVRHKYTGQEWDGETGLYYYGARYYNPLVGRFISADTMISDPSNPQSLNRYSYVINNPLRYTDPTGHECDEDGCDDPDPGPGPDPYIPPTPQPQQQVTSDYSWFATTTQFGQIVADSSANPDAQTGTGSGRTMLAPTDSNGNKLYMDIYGKSSGVNWYDGIPMRMDWGLPKLESQAFNNFVDCMVQGVGIPGLSNLILAAGQVAGTMLQGGAIDWAATQMQTPANASMFLYYMSMGALLSGPEASALWLTSNVLYCGTKELWTIWGH